MIFNPNYVVEADAGGGGGPDEPDIPSPSPGGGGVTGGGGSTDTSGYTLEYGKTYKPLTWAVQYNGVPVQFNGSLKLWASQGSWPSGGDPHVEIAGTLIGTGGTNLGTIIISAAQFRSST